MIGKALLLALGSPTFLISTLPCSSIPSSEQDFPVTGADISWAVGLAGMADLVEGGWVVSKALSPGEGGSLRTPQAPRGQRREENWDTWKAREEGLKVVAKTSAVKM